MKMGRGRAGQVLVVRGWDGARAGAGTGGGRKGRAGRAWPCVCAGPSAALLHPQPPPPPIPPPPPPLQVPEAVRGKTDALDALGNTTAATGKGFAIGSAVLTSLSLLAAFKAQAGMTDNELSIADPVILSGVLFGV